MRFSYRRGGGSPGHPWHPIRSVRDERIATCSLSLIAMHTAPGSADDILQLLAGNHRAYIRSCACLRDPMLQHLIGQLASHRMHPLVELERASVVDRGRRAAGSHMLEHMIDGLVGPMASTDHGIIGQLEQRERSFLVFCGELLHCEGLSSRLRMLLLQQMEASSNVMVILVEAKRTGDHRSN